MVTRRVGLLVCVAAVCVAYVVLGVWPRRHYPRFFAVLAGVATVWAMYEFQALRGIEFFLMFVPVINVFVGFVDGGLLGGLLGAIAGFVIGVVITFIEVVITPVVAERLQGKCGRNDSQLP